MCSLITAHAAHVRGAAVQTDVSTSADFIDPTEIAELLLLVHSRHRYVKHLSFHLSNNDPLFSAILKVLPSLFIF